MPETGGGIWTGAGGGFCGAILDGSNEIGYRFSFTKISCRTDQPHASASRA